MFVIFLKYNLPPPLRSPFPPPLSCLSPPPPYLLGRYGTQRTAQTELIHDTPALAF